MSREEVDIISGLCRFGYSYEIEKNKCTEDIKKLLGEFSKITGRKNKKDKIIEIYKYLLNNIWYVKDSTNFKKTIIDKCIELKQGNLEFEDLIEICNKMLNELREFQEDPNLVFYKKMENVICDNNKSVYENLINSKIIVKHDKLFKSYDRDELIFKNTNLSTGEEIRYTDSDIFKNKNFVFYELINTGDETYFLIPYETKTFIKKYSSN
jgi:hypothetical protein